MKFAIPLLLTYKTQKLTKTSENNKAKGLTNANQGVQIHNIWHSSTTIRIGVLSPSHRLLAKIVQHNLWPVVRRSDLTLKKAQFVYAIHLRLPFCLCKHIMSVMLEARDEGNTGLPFGCLLTQIVLQSDIIIVGKPKMKIQQPIGKQTLMKSNAQLQRDDSSDEVPIIAAMPVGFPDMASSSQTVPPSEPEINFS
jgi:hypothetical protein